MRVLITAVSIPPRANATLALEELYGQINLNPEAAGDFTRCFQSTGSSSTFPPETETYWIQVFPNQKPRCDEPTPSLLASPSQLLCTFTLILQLFCLFYLYPTKTICVRPERRQ